MIKIEKNNRIIKIKYPDISKVIFGKIASEDLQSSHAGLS